MPTDEERKAVAKRLRTLASHAPADAEMVLDALDLYPGEYTEGFDPRCVEHLADLIEPAERTCRNKVIDTSRNTPLEYLTDDFCCSVCNSAFYADSEGVNYPIDWEFCPACGAKVVSE